MIRVLERRGLPLPDHLRVRLAAETDLARLDGWLEAAITAARVEDVFGHS